MLGDHTDAGDVAVGKRAASSAAARATRYLAHTIVNGYRRCVNGLRWRLIARASATPPLSFLFDQIFGEVEPHHDFAELRLHPPQLAVLRMVPLSQFDTHDVTETARVLLHPL